MSDAKSSFTVYYGQGIVCLALAYLSDEPYVHGHWLMMARTWSSFAEDTDGTHRKVQTPYH